MASLVAKKKGNHLYYYVVESARVDGKPRIVHQAYLGTAEKLAELVQRPHRPRPSGRHHPRVRLARRPLAGRSANRRLGLAAIALAYATLRTLARSLPLAGRHSPHLPARPQNRSRRLVSLRPSCRPLWGFPPERFTSQAFWDAFEQILPEGPEALSPADDPLEQAQLRLLGVWKEKQLVSRRLLAYDTTNFYTYIASTNTRNQLAQRGHNKQGRHNLRQVGLSYVLDGEHGLELMPSRLSRETWPMWKSFPRRLTRITRMLDQNQIARDTVTLVLDKGSAALANTVALGRGRRGLDLGLALESSAGGVTRTSDGGITRLQQRPTRSARRGRENCWCMARSICAW